MSGWQRPWGIKHGLGKKAENNKEFSWNWGYEHFPCTSEIDSSGIVKENLNRNQNFLKNEKKIKKEVNQVPMSNTMTREGRVAYDQGKVGIWECLS